MRSLGHSLVLAALLLAALGPRIALAAVDKCGAEKAKALGRHAAAGLDCHSRAAKAGVAVDAACLARAETRLADAFAKLEAKGCAPGDAAGAADSATEFWNASAARLRTATGAADACAAAKLRSTGRQARDAFECHAKALSQDLPPDAACFARARQRFHSGLTRAEKTRGCLTLDDGAPLELVADAHVARALDLGLCADLVEDDVPGAWSASAVGGFPTELTALAPEDALVGSAALRAETTAPFGWTLRHTAPGPLDVSEGIASELRFAVRAENTNTPTWQGSWPTLTLEDAFGRRRRYEPTAPRLPDDGFVWRPISVPLDGGAGWTSSGDESFDRSAVAAVELEADTWGGGFRIDLDGLAAVGPTCSAPCDCGAHGSCGESLACECDLGYSGARCDECAHGWAEGPDEACALESDGEATVWPNAHAPANSSAWLAAHHDDVERLEPTVLVLNFVNPSSPSAVRTLVDSVIAGLAEGSRERGDEIPGATPQLEYRILGDAVIDLRDGVDGRDPAPPGWPYQNSTLYPRRPDGEPGAWRFDYATLFDQDFAAHYGVIDPNDPGRYLELCELAERGLVHDVWVVGSGDVPDAGAAEVLESKPLYDIAGNRVGESFDRCAGNGCFDLDVPVCGVSLRVGFVNYSRGPGCYIHSQAHGIESTAARAVTPGLTAWFNRFAGFDLDTRWGLPLSSLYGASCPSPPCIEHPTPSSLALQTYAGPRERDPFDAVCGNVHFPPNAEAGYDYANPEPVLSSCRAYGTTGERAPVSAQDWSAYSDYGDCGGEFLVWWMQRMPGASGARTFGDGRPMRSVWPYLFY